MDLDAFHKLGKLVIMITAVMLLAVWMNSYLNI